MHGFCLISHPAIQPTSKTGLWPRLQAESTPSPPAAPPVYPPMHPTAPLPTPTLPCPPLCSLPGLGQPAGTQQLRARHAVQPRGAGGRGRRVLGRHAARRCLPVPGAGRQPVGGGGCGWGCWGWGRVFPVPGAVRGDPCGLHGGQACWAAPSVRCPACPSPPVPHPSGSAPPPPPPCPRCGTWRAWWAASCLPARRPPGSTVMRSSGACLPTSWLVTSPGGVLSAACATPRHNRHRHLSPPPRPTALPLPPAHLTAHHHHRTTSAWRWSWPAPWVGPAPSCCWPAWGRSRAR